MNQYRVRGADQKEYGPIDADQLRQWIAERRLNQFSQACRDEDGVWRPLGQFAEFASDLGAGAASATASATGGGGIVTPASEGLPLNAPLTPPSPGQPASGREGARRRLAVPALFLIILSTLGLIQALTAPLWRKSQQQFLANLPNIPPESRAQIEQAFNQPLGPMDYGLIGLSALMYVLILVGALKMRKLESFGLSATAAVLALLPCTCCCVGLPFGIWALVVMTKPEVKEHFT